MIGVVIGGDSEHTIKLALMSLKGCEKVFYLDGGSTDKTLEIAKDYCDEIWHNHYDKDRQGMSSIQKDVLLNKLRASGYTGEWITYLDADEMLEENGLQKIEKNIKDVTDTECFDIRMVHLMDNITTEDATSEIHRTLTRVFKLTDDVYFPFGEHVCLHGMKDNVSGFILSTIVFHLAYCDGIWAVKKRYDGQVARRATKGSHDLEYLKNWNLLHLLGVYPKRKINPLILPDFFLKELNINKEELYFMNRNLETKHFIDAINWRNFFKCETAIEWGCGKGPRVYALNNVGVKAVGRELSKVAVDQAYDKHITVGDITKDKDASYDLAIGYDLLEHISYSDLSTAIENLIFSSKKYIIVSVPVKGDPNLESDPSHLIKETKEWWIKQFTNKGLKLIETPKHFLYVDQLMVFEK